MNILPNNKLSSIFIAEIYADVFKNNMEKKC